MTTGKHRRLLVRALTGVVVMAAVAMAFYIGGVAGFTEGFVTGSSVARMTAGALALDGLNADDARSKAVLEDFVDSALASHDTTQKLQAPWFDALGAGAARDAALSMMPRVMAYRRKHPTPPEGSGGLGTSQQVDAGPSEQEPGLGEGQPSAIEARSDDKPESPHVVPKDESVEVPK